MISEIIGALSTAFTSVVELVEQFLGDEGLFGAIGDLSSNLFGGEDA